MSLSEILREKAVEVVGKASLVTAVSSEVVHKAGFLDNVTLIQAISAVGVISLFVDRTVSSVTSVQDKTKSMRIFTYVIWALTWSLSAMLIVAVL